ncbi:MAG: four helix bundle protein [Ferruginibacter sp.]|nr:four helix bundle protein [Ferruginibacter sp.]
MSNLILTLSFDFSLKIIKYCSVLEEEKRFVIAKQLLKSGTSIGANIREAQNAESKNDFIHKFKIAAKEAEESEYWLLLCKESGYVECTHLLVEIKSIIKIITKIIAASKRKSD